MKILIRVDDFGMTPQAGLGPLYGGRLPDVGLALAQGFHAAMGGLPYMAAVVPAAVDAGGLAWLRGKPAGLTIALHGWDHRDAGGRDEFNESNEDGIRKCLDAGRRKLGPTPYFVPPFNAVSDTLFRACYHEGIRYVFGGPVDWPTPPNPMEKAMGVKYIPAWARLYGATRWVQAPGNQVLCTELNMELVRVYSFAVLTLHLPWEFARDPELFGVRDVARRLREFFDVLSADDFVKALPCGSFTS